MENTETRGLYVIYDKLAEKSGPVFEAVNDAVAARAARQMLHNVVDSEDYELMYIGRIVDKTAQLELDANHVVYFKFNYNIGSSDIKGE